MDTSINEKTSTFETMYPRKDSVLCTDRGGVGIIQSLAGEPNMRHAQSISTHDILPEQIRPESAAPARISANPTPQRSISA